jgi:OFA family oxalate/formate antiporter-like MFS transporter
MIASFVANIMVGSAYAWGVFSPQLVAMFGYTQAQASLAFSLALGLIPISMILAGKVSPKIGVRATILIGGLFYGVGFVLTSFVTENALTLHLSYGVMSALGIGTVYGTAVPNAVKWFPDKRGLAGGLIVAGFGSGAIIFAPIFGAATASIGLLETFRYFGIVFGVLVAVATIFIASPPEGYKPAGWTPPTTGAGAVATVSLLPSEMMKTFRFWLMFVIFTLAMVGGIMIIGQAGNIARDRIGVEGVLIATAVLFLGVSNASGRIIWGAISDKIGRYAALLIMYVITIVMLFLLRINVDNYVLFVVSAMGVGLCFGGLAGTFPSISADNFGTAHMGTNYGILFIGFGIAAFVGPQMAARLYDITHSHNTAFVIAMVFSAIAFLLTLVLVQVRKKATA